MPYVQNELVKPVKYLTLWARFISALFVSIYATATVEIKFFTRTFQQNDSYYALTACLIISFLLIQFIHSLSQYLDVYFNWMKSLSERIILQFVLGVLLTICLEILIIQIEAGLFYRNFGFVKHLKKAFPAFIEITISMNILYFVWYFIVYSSRVTQLNTQMAVLLRHNIKQQAPEISLAQKNIEAQTFEATLGNKVFRIDIKDVICIRRESDVGYVYVKQERTYNFSYTFPKFKKMFDLSMFFQINRSDMVSIEVIESIQLVGKQYIIELKPGTDPNIGTKVSRDHSRAFKKWYDSFNVPDD